MCVTLPMPGSVSIMIFFGAASAAISFRSNEFSCLRSKSELELMLLYFTGVENAERMIYSK